MTVIFGTHGADTLTATSENDILLGLSGFDTLQSSFSEAVMFGSWGRDSLIVDHNHVAGDPERTVYDWSLFGDQGPDTISLTANVVDDTWQSGSPFVRALVDGGIGNDSITVDTVFDISDASAGLSPDVTVENRVVDIAGDNAIVLNTDIILLDEIASINNILNLGDGNDDVTITASGFGFNYAPNATYVVNLGDGDNELSLSDVTGKLTAAVTAGTGIDHIDIDTAIEEGNDEGYLADLDLILNGGDDIVDLNFSDQGGLGGGFQYEANVSADLGSGHNSFNATSKLSGNFIVRSESGNDNINIDIAMSLPNDFGNGYNVEVDAGDGDNTVSLNWSLPLLFGPSMDPTAQIVTGSGADNISVSGEGQDGDRTISITAGTGGDQVGIDQSLFQANFEFGLTSVRLEDFSLGDGDTVDLTGFNIGGAGDYTIATAQDLLDLTALPSGVLTFDQVGSDAVLTLDGGGSEPGDIVFVGLDLGSLGGTGGAPSDPPQSFYGNNTSNVFVGGDNDDTFFLRRFDDTATGNEGADLFRVNAVSPHVLDGDNHVITDLDFAEGDILRFDQFGAAWADDSVDPANTLQFVSDPSGFDNWIVDSVEDLTELEGSGALVLSALSGGAGTRLEFQDLAGDTATIDLWDVFA